MARFLRLAFLISFFVQIFVVNSQNYFVYELQGIDEKLDKQAKEMTEQFKILIDQMQQQQQTFEKRLKDQEDRLKENFVELFASNEQKLGMQITNAILTKLTTLETEKQQKIENLSSQLEQAQRFNKNSTEKIQECEQIAEQQSFKIEEFASNFSSQAIENEMKIQNMTERLEQEVLSRNNIVAQLQESQQNSSRLAEKIQELEIKIKNLLEMIPSSDGCEAIMTNSNLDNEIENLFLPDSGLPPFRVNCQRINGEIWTTIQRRQDGSVNFYRNWADYKNGFGDLDGEFWLGLEKLHQLTKNHEWELKIWLRDEEGNESFARYKKFKVDNETEQYKLTVGEFSGNVLDAMAELNGQKFSTPDRDNDEWFDGSCGIREKGAWWFGNCEYGWVHLNGDFDGNDEPNHWGIYWPWFAFKLKYSLMAIRRLK